MLFPDLNILVYAYDSASEDHEACLIWLESALNGKVPVCFSWHTIMGLMRILTTVKMVKNAFSPKEAMQIADDMMSTPVSRMLLPGPQHFSIFRQLVNETRISGARLSDAHIAALAIEHGATVISKDRDFRAFDGVKLFNPLVTG